VLHISVTVNKSIPGDWNIWLMLDQKIKEIKILDPYHQLYDESLES